MKSKILLLFIPFLLMTGCFNYNELNELALCTGMAIDYENNKYVVTYMIARSEQSNQNENSNKASTTTYEGRGKNISEAIQEINRICPKKTYIGHLNVIVISEDLAKKGLQNMLDYLLREPESRKTFFLILARNVKASETLKILSPLETFSSQNITNNIESVDQLQALAVKTQYTEFLQRILMEGVNPTINSITIDGDIKSGQKEESLESSEAKAFIKIDSVGIFNKDRLLGFATDDESRGINIILNKVSVMNITAKCEDNYITATTENLKTDIEIETKNNDIKIKLNVKGDAAISEINCKINLDDPKEIKKLEDKFNNKVKKFINKALYITQKEYKSDVFGFGNMIYREDYQTWKKIKDNWNNEIFPNIKINTKVNISLTKKGALKQTIKEEKDEK